MSLPVVLAIQGGMQALQTVGSVVSGISNANAAEKEGDIALAQARANANQVRRQGDRAMSTQLAAAGASGTVPVTGSNLELMMETARETELRALDEEWSGKMGQWASGRRAAGFRTEAFNSFLGGVGGMAGTYGQYKNMQSQGATSSGVLGRSFSRVRGYATN